MEAVGEALLSSLFELLLRKLQYPSDLLKYARREKVHKELKKWEEMLSEMLQLLNVAEDKQIDDPNVKAWLDRLRDLAYDMEDILEEFGYEALRRKAMGEEDEGQVGGRSSKVRKFIHTCSTCTIFSTSPVKNVKMGSKIMKITLRLEEISAQRTGLGLKCFDKVETITQSSSWERRRLTTCEAYGPWVKGRDADKQAVIEMLLMTPDEGASATSNVSVASIVAMGGMGKTTLARLVYDDTAGAMTGHFDVRCWVCVSNDFDIVGVTKTLLNSFASQRGNNSLDFHEIQSLLKKELTGKRFLIVLDDLWADIRGRKWDDLRSPFMKGAAGSKILITTRDRDVAVDLGGRKNIHELKQLSDDDCWSVFQTHAFEHTNIHEHPNLEAIGRKIANKCGGLPLAAKALGGLLRGELREREWRRVVDSKIWDLPADKCDIIPALRLSYTHLPSHLKRCFAYCAVFPQDYEFKKEELIPLWMAQGLIQQSNDGDRSRGEELGDQYFCELFSRSFFQLSSSSYGSEVVVFTMHDLVNDLAKYVAGGTCLHLDEEFKNNWQRPIPISTRHSSFVLGDYDTFKMFERFHKVEHLRSFMVVPTPTQWLPHYISCKVLQQLIPRLGHLRVLSLRYYCILEIPKEFGDLKLLKYLDLSGTEITCLPDSIGNLCNLQTLILSKCYVLTKLPDSIGGLYNLQTMELSKCVYLTRLPISIGNLVNLRRLIVSGCVRLKEMPSEVGKLKDLQVLSDFMVGGENNGLNIRRLREMSCLEGDLYISRLENVENVQDARGASLKLKGNLERLTLEWSPHSDGSRNDEMDQMSVLEYLEPTPNLNALSIRSYGGLAFPSWVGDTSFSKLVSVELMECNNCATLPCLGQLPSLRLLEIDGMARIKEVGAGFYAEAGVYVSGDKCFPCLESIAFKNMSEWEIWEGWSSAVEYPCLRTLTIENCPKLIKSLPIYLPHLTNLIVSKCRKLEFPVLILPSLKELNVLECNGTVLRSGVVLTSLTKLSILDISGLDKLHEGFVQSLQGLQDLTISGSAELACLWDDDDDDDGSGSENPPPPPLPPLETRRCDQSWGCCNIRSLRINHCAKLERLPNGWQKSLIRLEELVIGDCQRLVSFPKVGFPPNLKLLSISSCGRLKSLPHGMMNNLCLLLETLDISACSSLICFPKGKLPSTLKTIRIEYCGRLSCLPEGMMIQCYNQDSTLEDLSIMSCSSLTDFPKGSLPTTLKQLKIVACENLKSLPEGMMILDHQHYYSSNMAATRVGLRFLKICNCPSLVSFPRGKFPSSLEKLEIRSCEQLDPISEEMMIHSLQSLTISAYPSLKTLPDCLFDLSDLRISDCKNLELRPRQFQNFNRLKWLEITRCEKIKTPLAQWGLSTLPSLKHLSIEGVLHLDSDEPHPDLILLPSTLTSLYLSNLRKLKSLSSLSLQNLTSLSELVISDCPVLQSILPTEGLLPDTLSQLQISGCPLVEKRCSKEGGDDWPKIAHIPLIGPPYD